MGTEQRPNLSPEMSSDEFLRWYWLKSELVAFARDLGLRQGGPKAVLTDRISACLRGVKFVEKAVPKRGGGAQLMGELTESTIVPVGQRCSRLVREWFVARVGPSFRFDKLMREYFASADGTSTLGDALDHYAMTRGSTNERIDPQFEYNRFARAWHAAHPGAGRDAFMAAWRGYRKSPIDERERA